MEDVYITININEGEQYEVSAVEISGELRDIKEETIQAMVLSAPGQIFSEN